MNLLIKSLRREQVNRPPMWLMRQAGRYLPEYREIRKQAGSFLNLCYNPDLAAEVTLQPIKRFNFDVAILFADILVIPDALGIKVKFVEGEGPVLEKLPVNNGYEVLKKAINTLEENKPNIKKQLGTIWQTVSKVKKELDDDKALMGFCGAPWTVALYCLDNKPSKASEITRSVAYKYPDLFDKLMDILVESSAEYLCGQIENGADAVQVFDSWASQIPDSLYERALKQPTLKLCKLIKAKHPNTPIILFPRGLSESKLMDLAHMAPGHFEGMSLDYTVDMTWACENLQDKVCIQGNLDPAVMLTTPENVQKEAEKILKIATQKPGYIFNFGHGILPTVPIENVEALCETVQNWQVQT
ncbi:MAG: uroporphyrinogen decarboxylase [Alphaproteobacteria bacterium]|jgi:uroporphyrinogen decarboxylase